MSEAERYRRVANPNQIIRRYTKISVADAILCFGGRSGFRAGKAGGYRL